MKTTVSIYVDNNHLIGFLKLLKVLEELPIENNYQFNPCNYQYSLNFSKFKVQVNLPVDEYLKLEYCYNKQIQQNHES